MLPQDSIAKTTSNCRYWNRFTKIRTAMWRIILSQRKYCMKKLLPDICCERHPNRGHQNILYPLQFSVLSTPTWGWQVCQLSDHSFRFKSQNNVGVVNNLSQNRRLHFQYRFTNIILLQQVIMRRRKERWAGDLVSTMENRGLYKYPTPCNRKW